MIAPPIRAEIVLALCTELAEQEMISRDRVPRWDETMPTVEQDRFRRAVRGARNASRLKTVLGHLKALWPEQFETKTTSKKEAKTP